MIRRVLTVKNFGSPKSRAKHNEHSYWFIDVAGSLAVQTLGIPFSSDTMWPWIFVPDVPLVILSIGMFMLVPESPVSILEREGDIDKVGDE